MGFFRMRHWSFLALAIGLAAGPADVASQSVQWSALYEGFGDGTNQARAMAVDPGGRVFVTGYSSDGASGFDVATVAYDLDGNELWVRRWDGPGGGIDEASNRTGSAGESVPGLADHDSGPGSRH